jgi:beta-lactamase superfamily II metal-dependent hydrolase
METAVRKLTYVRVPIVAAMSVLFACHTAAGEDAGHAFSAGTFTLWQLPNQTASQMMSYVIRTVHGKVLVIDGGTAGDAPYLRAFLKNLDGHVDRWFLTHAHDDHFGALGEIFKSPEGLRIDTVYASMPDAAWINEVADPSEKKAYAGFMAAAAQANRPLIELSLGQKIRLDGLVIRVLGVKNPEIRKNPLNNSCVVLRIADQHKSVLFLADLGLDAGEKLLKSPLAKRLHSDYVQMAHHGQNGVSETFYKAVNPTYCLWPTPKWLWDNDSGAGKGSGPWRTGEVRGWMDRLPIRKHYLMFEGLQTIE